MNKKLLILFGLALFFVSFASAESIYKEDTLQDLKVPCFNNNSYCSPSSVCNLTMIRYDGTILINNELMSFNSAYHNYTLNTTHTAESGEHRIVVVCTDGGIKGKSTFTLIITPTGKSISTSSAITQGLILFIIFGVTIFFLIFAGTTENPGVKLFFNVVGYIAMFIAVGTGYILMQNSEVQSNLSFTLEALIFVIGIVFIVIMFYIMINQTRRALELMRIKKGFGSEYDNPQMF